MNPSHDEISQHERLRTEPTVRAWRLELDLLLSGKRKAALLEIGSSRQYVRRLMVDASDQINATIAFERALCAVVSAWIPEEMTESYNVSLLELITAYTPRNAFKKILSSLSLRRHLGRRNIQDPEASTLTILALVALEAYYPSPPDHSAKDEGFRRYVALLRALADDNATAPHAFRRLVELESPSLNTPEARATVSVKGVIKEFVQYGIGPHRRLLHAHLADLLGLCLSVRLSHDSGHPHPMFQDFRDALQLYGADIVEEPRRSGNLIIRLASDKYISLPVAPSTLLAWIESADYESNISLDLARIARAI